MPKKTTGTTKSEKKALKRRAAILAANPAMIPLCEMFAICDDVFSTEGAFSQEHINKSLGRIYRQWIDTRSKLDEDFNPKRYPKRQRNNNSPDAKARRVVLKTKGS